MVKNKEQAEDENPPPVPIKREEEWRHIHYSPRPTWQRPAEAGEKTA